MRETDFIERNQEKWARYERALEEDDPAPELLRELYLHTTDDLAYARTFYPNRSVRLYLNGLAQRTYVRVHRGRSGQAGQLLTFWTDSLPRVVHRHRRTLLLSLAIFLLAMAIGVVSFMIDDEFANVILGEGYVSNTLDNIESGDPLAVYKARAPLGMSVHITLNNLLVALLTFVSGVFFAVGAVVQLLRNGIMVGVFQYFFYDQGLLRESALTIWMHGTLEISSLVIAGGAGLVLGSGLLFPGTHSRLAALKHSARDGLKIMLGTVPLFVLAGFIEGYLTRLTDAPDPIRALFILACLGFVGWYYGVYPRVVARRLPPRRPGTYRNASRGEGKIVLRRIRAAGENLAATLSVLRAGGGRLFGGVAAVTAGFCFLSFWFFNGAAANRYFFDSSLFGNFVNAHELLTTFSRNRGVSYLLLTAVTFYGLLRLSFHLVWRGVGAEMLPANWRSEVYLFVVSVFLALGFAFSGKVAALFVFLLLPFLLTLAYAGYSGLASVAETFRFVYTHLLRTYGDFLILLVLALPVLKILDSVVGGLFFSFFDWLVYGPAGVLADANRLLETVLYFYGFALLVLAWSVALTLNFYSLREIERADGLLARIAVFGKHRRLRGMELD